MHKLERYLERNRLTQADFAERVGTTQGAIARYIAGQRMPRPEVLVRIIDATGGEVTANDFLPEAGGAPGAGPSQESGARVPEGHLERAARTARLSA